MKSYEAAKIVAPLIPLIQEGLEAGCVYNHQFFDAVVGEGVNPPLAPSIIRFGLRRHLADKVILIDECEADDVANNGVSLRVGPIHVRVWKTEDAAIPSPGRSRTKDKFLRQVQTRIQLKFPYSQDEKRNLVVLWKLDDYHNLNQLYLACPQGDPTGKNELEWEWCIPIDPADVYGSIAVLNVTPDTSLDLPFEPEDLPPEKDEPDDEEKDDPA